MYMNVPGILLFLQDVIAKASNFNIEHFLFDLLTYYILAVLVVCMLLKFKNTFIMIDSEV